MRRYLPVAAATAFTLASTAALAFPGVGSEAMIDGADANRDGVVTRAEFAAARAGTFARMDRNHDGVVTVGELPRRAQSDRPEARLLRRSLEAADANGDGRITRDEFVRAPAPLFDQADGNRDNRLDAGEIAAAKARLKAVREGR